MNKFVVDPGNAAQEFCQPHHWEVIEPLLEAPILVETCQMVKVKCQYLGLRNKIRQINLPSDRNPRPHWRWMVAVKCPNHRILNVERQNRSERLSAIEEIKSEGQPSAPAKQVDHPIGWSALRLRTGVEISAWGLNSDRLLRLCKRTSDLLSAGVAITA